jgi:hypothetical protein
MIAIGVRRKLGPEREDGLTPQPEFPGTEPSSVVVERPQLRRRRGVECNRARQTFGARSFGPKRGLGDLLETLKGIDDL